MSAYVCDFYDGGIDDEEDNIEDYSVLEEKENKDKGAKFSKNSKIQRLLSKVHDKVAKNSAKTKKTSARKRKQTPAAAPATSKEDEKISKKAKISAEVRKNRGTTPKPRVKSVLTSSTSANKVPNNDIASATTSKAKHKSLKVQTASTSAQSNSTESKEDEPAPKNPKLERTASKEQEMTKKTLSTPKSLTEKHQPSTKKEEAQVTPKDSKIKPQLTASKDQNMSGMFKSKFRKFVAPKAKNAVEKKKKNIGSDAGKEKEETKQQNPPQPVPAAKTVDENLSKDEDIKADPDSSEDDDGDDLICSGFDDERDMVGDGSPVLDIKKDGTLPFSPNFDKLIDEMIADGGRRNPKKETVKSLTKAERELSQKEEDSHNNSSNRRQVDDKSDDSSCSSSEDDEENSIQETRSVQKDTESKKKEGSYKEEAASSSSSEEESCSDEDEKTGCSSSSYQSSSYDQSKVETKEGESTLVEDESDDDDSEENDDDDDEANSDEESDEEDRDYISKQTEMMKQTLLSMQSHVERTRNLKQRRLQGFMRSCKDEIIKLKQAVLTSDDVRQEMKLFLAVFLELIQQWEVEAGKSKQAHQVILLILDKQKKMLGQIAQVQRYRIQCLKEANSKFIRSARELTEIKHQERKDAVEMLKKKIEKKTRKIETQMTKNSENNLRLKTGIQSMLLDL